MRWLIALLIIIVSHSAAQAEVYQWVDDQGIVHFTDNLDKVPARYRKKVKTMESITGEKATSPSPPAEPPAPAATSQEKKTELYGGHNEGWWRSRFAELRIEITKIRDALPAKRDELAKLRRKWVISMGRVPEAGETREDRFIKPPPDENEELSHALSTPGKHRIAYYAMKDEIEKDDARIKELEGQLAALDADATRAGVPFEWRK